jgi:hypothetical protein
MENTQNAAVFHSGPHSVALVRPSVNAPRELQSLLGEELTVAIADPVRRNVSNNTRTDCWTCWSASITLAG